MGSAQTKDITSTKDMTTQTNQELVTPLKHKRITEHTFISPLQKTISNSREDPRSPGSRRTPLHTPRTTPNLNKNIRERMMRSQASRSADPRSPSMICRTPLHLSAAEGVPRTPPPFRGCDPRSPCVTRTPLSLSAQDVVVVDDLAVVGQEIAEPEGFAEGVIEEKAGEEIIAIGASVEIVPAGSCADSSDSIKDSTGVSAEVKALALSPQSSPSLGSRKRKDIERTQGLSPLKKSYSAPFDENTTSPSSSSPVNKSIASVARARTPLSPLSRRTVVTTRQQQHCTGVQPIKFRVDPGILG